MDQHPIPRQITSFEFKLIGFMTLKQFIYIVLSVPLGFIVFRLFPIPIINAVLGLVVGGAGFVFAFVPINDRPLDVWVKNFIKKINSPTIFVFKKENTPIYFFHDLFFVNDPHRVLSHVESQQKLSTYLATKQKPAQKNPRKQAVQQILQNPLVGFSDKKSQINTAGNLPIHTEKETLQQAPAQAQQQGPKKPFLVGLVKNNKQIPLSGVLVYVKDNIGTPIRLLKTNPHGIFATYSPLPSNEYTFEIKDPKGTYFFDTMKIAIAELNPKTIEFYSKELL